MTRDLASLTIDSGDDSDEKIRQVLALWLQQVWDDLRRANK